MFNKDFLSGTRYVIDRIESGIAVLVADCGETFEISVDELPEAYGEGSILLFDNGLWSLDERESARRRQELNTRLQGLFDRKP